MLNLAKSLSKIRSSKKERKIHPPPQPAANTLTLPVELWLTVIESLASRADNPTGLFLYPLLFLNSFFKDIVESILYREIYCTPTADPNRYVVRIKLLQHLASCSRVALHVRMLTLGYKEDRVFPRLQTLDVNVQYWDEVRTVLQSVTKLQHLNMDCPLSSIQGWRQQPLFAGCTFQLISLRLSGSGELLHVDQRFLVKQSQIQELDVLAYVGSEISTMTVSDLKILHVDSDELSPEFIRPSLRCLEWFSRRSIVSGSIPTIISLHLLPGPSPDLRQVVRNLPSLKLLQITLSANLKLTQPAELSAILEALMPLRRLQRLILRGWGIRWRENVSNNRAPSIDQVSRSLLASRAFETLFQLDMIIFSITPSSITLPFAEQWERGEPQPTITKYDPNMWKSSKWWV